MQGTVAPPPVRTIELPRRILDPQRCSRLHFDRFVTRAKQSIRRARHAQRKLKAEIERRAERARWLDGFFSSESESHDAEIRRRCPALFMHPQVAAVAQAVGRVLEATGRRVRTA